MWKLVIEDDEGKRTVVPLSRDDYTIGRQEGNTIRLTERNVSRTHGRVHRNRNANGSGAFILEDLRSYNGVFVNGLRVAHTQDLQHGDLIQIGDYRLVIHDDAVVTMEEPQPVGALSPTDSDAKATIPIAPAYRGQTLADRPNRLVMLVGPTPGIEYPLDRERMTVGRAEDASISVNHNSVSRLHCEIHALGDGRFEIVDKGSSNGVRVNAVELRRSIIEAGDVIELGDVRFKFVGAGQIFVPGPNESQQLTAISDREADLAVQKRGWGGYVLPIVGAGIVGAGIIVAFVFFVGRRTMTETVDAGITAADTEQAALAEARRTCTVDDCEAQHRMVAALPDDPRRHDNPDVRAIESTWAESVLKKARAEQDPTARRPIVALLLADPLVDPTQKKQGEGLLDPLNASPPPTTASADLSATTERVAALPARDAGPLSPAPTPRDPVARPPPSHPNLPNTTTNPNPTPPSTAPKPAGPTAYERAREAALRGEPAAVRQILETKVRGGHGTTEEANLVRQACKAMSDKACADDVKAKYPGS
jgi:pSer/pThr/pTyr-binding forkhead associated (FHA) protein